MNKNTTIIERRKELIEVSKMAKAMRAAEEIDGTINYVLLNYIYKTENANEFKTFEEWQKEGFRGVGKAEREKNRSWRRGKILPDHLFVFGFTGLQEKKRNRS